MGTAPDASGCVSLSRDLRAGEVPAVADLLPASCASETVSAFRYDRQMASLIAKSDLRRGEVVGAPPLSLLPAVRPGEALRLTVRVGPVTVERRVVTLQAGRSDGSVFVQAEDGSVFAVQVARLSP